MRETLDMVLEYVDKFAALYVDAVLQLCKQKKIDVMKVTFTVEKGPYKFPPKMVVNQDEKKEIIYSFDLHIKMRVIMRPMLMQVL